MLTALKQKFSNVDQVKLSKIIVTTFMILTFIGVLMPDSFLIGLSDIRRIYGEDFRLSAFQMILRWINLTSFIVLPIAVYFDKPIFKKIAIYFCGIVALVNMGFFGEYLPHFTSEYGTGIADIRYLPSFIPAIMRNGVFRGILFFATSITQILAIVLVLLRDVNVLKFKKNEILPFIGLTLILALSIVPPYAPEIIANSFSNAIFKRFSIYHIAWILLLIGEIVVLTLIFKKRSMEDRYILVLILALTLLLQFNQLFSSLGELTCKRMPLQLCNIAAYVTVISIMKKNRNLFLFNILINVAGGVIALVMLDAETSNGILSSGNVHYILEHHNVIIVPLLCLILGVFKPITMKDFKNFVIYFSAYYIIILILGTTFNALKSYTGSDYFYCNYLFMFDQATAARLLPFAGKLFDIKLAIGHVTLYPVLQPLVYLAFFGIGTGMFFLLKFAVKDKNGIDTETVAPTNDEGETTENPIEVEQESV